MIPPNMDELLDPRPRIDGARPMGDSLPKRAPGQWTDARIASDTLPTLTPGVVLISLHVVDPITYRIWSTLVDHLDR